MVINKKGQKKPKNPLSMRILAFFMAAAMAFSVVYFNDRSADVEATTPAVTDVTDDGYINQVYNNSADSVNISAPATGITFNVPADGSESSFCGKTLYTDDDGASYYLDPTGLTDPTEVNVNAYYEIVWRTVSDGSGDNPGTVTNGNTLYAFYHYTEYSDESGPYDDLIVDIASHEYELAKTIMINTYDPEQWAFDAASNPASVTDMDVTETDSQKYYGAVTYEVSRDGGTASEFTSLEGVNAEINRLDADGTYDIKKVIKAPSTGGSAELFSQKKSGTINNHVLMSYSATYDEVTIPGDMTTGTYALTVPQTGTLSASKDITVNFTTDSDVTPTVTITGTGGSATTPTGSDNAYSFTINAPATVAHDDSINFSVEVEDADGKTDTFTIDVNYSSPKPSFSGEKVDADTVSDPSTVIYKNKTQSTVSYSSVISIEDASASLSNLWIVNADNASITSKDSGDYSSVDISSFTPGSEVSGYVDLIHGTNFIAMVAESAYEGGTTSYVVPSKVAQVFYDDTDPYVDGDFALSQDSDPVTVEGSGKSYTATVTAMKDVDFEFKVADMQKERDDSDSDGSGIALLTIDGNDVTSTIAPDGTVNYSLLKDTSQSGGGSKEVEIYIEDNAGNSDTYTITLTYLNEKATITEVFNPGTFTDNDFVKWNDLSNKKVTVTYTIKTMFELETKANDGIIIDVDGVKTNITDQATKSGSEGAWVYTVTYQYDDTQSKAGYVVALTVKNINGCETTHNTKVISIDITDPTISVTDGNGNLIDETKWYDNLVLKVTVDDGTVSSGIVKTVASGTDKDEYTGSPFYATVNKSTLSTGTPVTFKAYDEAGNESATSSKTYKVDKDKPVISLKVDGKPYSDVDGTVVSDSDPVIEFSASDSLSGLSAPGMVELRINGAVKTTDPFGSKKLSELLGSTPDPTKDYTVELYAKDVVGNEASYETTFRADGVAPDITGKIDTKAKKSNHPTYFNQDVTLSVTIVDSNLKRTGISVTDANGHTLGVTWTQSGTTWNGTIKASSEGDYKITVKATDDGQLSNSWSQNFTIDKTAPEVTTLLNGEEYNLTNSYHGKLTTGVNVVDSNEDTVDVLILREIPWGGTETIKSSGKGPFYINDDGYYTVTYTVSDKAGNDVEKTIGFTVDDTAPVNNLYITTNDPAKISTYYNNYVNVVNTFTSRSSQENYRYGQFYNTDVTIELGYFDYNLNWVYVTDSGQELAPIWTYSDGYGKATITVSSEGYHDIQIWTEDMTGNSTNDSDVGKRLRFTIDKTAPVITTTLNGADYSEGSGVRYLNTNGSVGVSVYDTNVDTSDLKRYYKETPPGGAARTSESYINEGTETYVEEADYEVQYVAVDKAGNASATRNVYFRVDRTAPQLDISNVGDIAKSGTVNVSFTVREAFYWDMSKVTIRIYKRKEGGSETLEKTIEMTPKSAADTSSYAFSEDAIYRIEFEAEDKCGNKANKEYTFIKDGTAPRIILSGVGNYDTTDKEVELVVTVDEEFYSSNKVTLTGTRIDIDGKKNPITFKDFVTNRQKVSELKELFNKDGIYDIEVTSTDKAGNSSSKKVHFTIDTTPPEIGDLSKYDGKMLKEFKWDIDLDKLVRDLTVCEITLYMDGVEYDGVSPIEDGSHVLKVEAVDEMGHKSSKEVTFVLDTKGPNIIVSNVEEGDKFYEEREISVSVQLDEDVLDEVTLNGESVALSNNQATIKIDKKDDYTLTAKAHDEAGNESSIDMEFTYASEVNLLLIGIIAGAVIVLLLLILLIMKKRRA